MAQRKKRLVYFLGLEGSSCLVAQPCLLRPHGLQDTRSPCPSPTPGACSNSCPSSRWCHLTISSSVIPFSSCLQFFQAPGVFPMSHFFASVSQSIRTSASASVLPMNIQDWFPLGACSNSCPSSWWCHTTISSSAVPFTSCLQSFPA